MPWAATETRRQKLVAIVARCCALRTTDRLRAASFHEATLWLSLNEHSRNDTLQVHAFWNRHIPVRRSHLWLKSRAAFPETQSRHSAVHQGDDEAARVREEALIILAIAI